MRTTVGRIITRMSCNSIWNIEKRTGSCGNGPATRYTPRRLISIPTFFFWLQGFVMSSPLSQSCKTPPVIKSPPPLSELHITHTTIILLEGHQKPSRREGLRKGLSVVLNQLISKPTSSFLRCPCLFENTSFAVIMLLENSLYC